MTKRQTTMSRQWAGLPAAAPHGGRPLARYLSPVNPGTPSMAITFVGLESSVRMGSGR